jgi:plastocyanin
MLVASGLGALLVMGAAQAPQIGIEDFKYLPPALTVPAGTTVIWVNRDAELHTVTSSSGVFASPGREKGETFSYTFAAPGTYVYFCALHPYMTATITVR